MAKDATEIILESMLSDPTRTIDLQEIITRHGAVDRSIALQNYFGKSLVNYLTVEKEVVNNLINGASWEDVARRLDTLLVVKTIDLGKPDLSA